MSESVTTQPEAYSNEYSYHEVEQLEARELRQLAPGTRLSFIVENARAPYGIEELRFEKSLPTDPDSWTNSKGMRAQRLEGWFLTGSGARRPVAIQGNLASKGVSTEQSLVYAHFSLVSGGPDDPASGALRLLLHDFTIRDVTTVNQYEFDMGLIGGMIAYNPETDAKYWRIALPPKETGKVLSILVEEPK
ncbi:MAG TPA: hypothetical protein VLF60_02655 [Candidatus Saccharimonadales bacterium]|nr:hypothetical protein [Candidatus Saccharimonadales bacterium]